MKTEDHQDEHEADERQNALLEASEHDRWMLVRAAKNLLKYGTPLSPEESLVLGRILRVFDPPRDGPEEPDISF